MSHTLILWFCDHRWETPPATVNAYYNPARNQISKPQFHVLFVINFKVHRLDVYPILCTISNSKKKSVMNCFFFHTLYNVTFLGFFPSVSSWNTSATILQKRISSVSRMPGCFFYNSATHSYYDIMLTILKILDFPFFKFNRKHQLFMTKKTQNIFLLLIWKNMSFR